VFEIRGDVVADLAADYINPAGKAGVTAEFPDAAGGSWAFFNCSNGGLLSTAAAGDVKLLNSQFKAFGSPLGLAYGLEDQGDELRVIRWNDDTQYDLLGTFNTQDLTAGKCGSVEFVLRLPPGEVGKQLDFVLHNAGSHLSDATALKVRAYTNVQQAAPQTDVTDKVQARFHNRLVTPLGPYAGLFGGVAAGVEPTLKVKLNYWRDGTIRYLEFPQDSALDLTGK
jgi:hypothetical protein